MSRVFVTGLGSVTSLGHSVESMWRALLSGQSGIGPLTRIDVTDLATTIGGEVPGLEEPPFELNDRVAWRRMDRSSRFAVCAAHQVVTDAGLSQSDLTERCAVVVGAGLSGLETLQQQTDVLLKRGPRRVSPLTIPLLMPNAAPACVSLAFGITGPAWTVSGACASSGLAIIEACELLRRGGADRAITGGTEASLTRLGIASFCNMGAMTKSSNDRPHKAVRPFDLNRDGLVMSEGAGLLLLETEASLQRRGAVPYAELIGHGATSDAYHLVAPDPSATGSAKAVQLAIEHAGLVASEIADNAYINAHGTGTRANDVAETQALRRVFDAADQLQISSTKSMTGHLIGAAGAIESIACILALRDGQLPPTINLETPDPECDLDYIPLRSRSADVQFALNNTFGFGGHNVSLVFRRV